LQTSQATPADDDSSEEETSDEEEEHEGGAAGGSGHGHSHFVEALNDENPKQDVSTATTSTEKA
jgi:hypothetical protein